MEPVIHYRNICGIRIHLGFHHANHHHVFPISYVWIFIALMDSVMSRARAIMRPAACFFLGVLPCLSVSSATLKTLQFFKQAFQECNCIGASKDDTRTHSTNSQVGQPFWPVFPLELSYMSKNSFGWIHILSSHPPPHPLWWSSWGNYTPFINCASNNILILWWGYWHSQKEEQVRGMTLYPCGWESVCIPICIPF